MGALGNVPPVTAEALLHTADRRDALSDVLWGDERVNYLDPYRAAIIAHIAKRPGLWWISEGDVIAEYTAAMQFWFLSLEHVDVDANAIISVFDQLVVQGSLKLLPRPAPDGGRAFQIIHTIHQKTCSP